MDGLGLVFTGQDNSGAAAVTDESSFDPIKYWDGKKKNVQDDIDKVIEAKKAAAAAGIPFKGIDTGKEWAVDRQGIVMPYLDEYQKAFSYYAKQGVDPAKDWKAGIVLDKIKQKTQTAVMKSELYQKQYDNWTTAVASDIDNGTNILDQEYAKKILQEFRNGDEATRDAIVKERSPLKRKFNAVKAAADLNTMLGEGKTYDVNSISEVGKGTNDYLIKTITTASPAELRKKSDLMWNNDDVIKENFKTPDDFYKWAEKAQKEKAAEELKSLPPIDKSKQEEWIGGSYKVGNNMFTPVVSPTNLYETPSGAEAAKANYEAYKKTVEARGGKPETFEEYKANSTPVVIPADAVSIQKSNTAEGTENSPNNWIDDKGQEFKGTVKMLRPDGKGGYLVGIAVEETLTAEQRQEGGVPKPIEFKWVPANNPDGTPNRNSGTVTGEWGGQTPEQIYNKSLNGDPNPKKKKEEPKKTIPKYKGVPQGGF
jgi:hypothetical protein